jgi:hypothetical protein
MHEMLGHHNFLLGHYGAALAHYETVMSSSTAGKAVRKRAIVCYIQGRKPEKALPLFAELFMEDPGCILAQRRVDDGCPCPEIIQEYLEHTTNITAGDMLSLGMLWSYCDPGVAAMWFTDALRQDESNVTVKHILAVLSREASNTLPITS